MRHDRRVRLSAAYSFFDGGELLVRSIENLRPLVDHLSVCFQLVSNLGNPMSEVSREALAEVAHRGLADDLVPFTPDPVIRAGRNEFAKRSVGLDLARRAGADHLLLMDADEFYEAAPFVAAKAAIDAHGWASTSVGFLNYYRHPTWRLTPTAGTVPFIARCSLDLEFAAGHPYLVDPTRSPRVDPNHHHHFPSSVIQMHHLTGVRHDLEEKLANSSQNDDPAVIAMMRERLGVLGRLQVGVNTLPGGLVIEIEEVEDLFDLAHLFPHEGDAGRGHLPG